MSVTSHSVKVGGVSAKGVRAFGIGESQGSDGPTLLVYDSFTDTTGTQLFSHTPDTDELGTGWQPLTSAASGYTGWTVQSNYLEADPAGTLNQAAGWSPGSFPYIQECANSTANPNTDSFIATRVVDNQNLYYGWIFDDNRLILRERSGGSEVTRGDTGAGASFSTMWIADDGAQITVGSDRGAARITYATTLFNSSTDCGVWTKTSISDLDDYYLVSGTVSPGDLP